MPLQGGKKKRSGKKRKPSAYNNFVKKYMAEQKRIHKGKFPKPVTELIRDAAKEWGKLSDAEKKKHA